MTRILLRDKMAANRRNTDANSKLTVLPKRAFQTAVVVEMFRSAGKLTEENKGNNDVNIQILAELETFIRHLAEINKIPYTAIENMYNTLANTYGVYNAQIAMETDNEEPPPNNILPQKKLEEISSISKKETTDKAN